jgi:molybdate transport system ATP-binding protein
VTLSVSVAHRRQNFALDVAFEAPTPGVVALFGASGSGKSTVIAAIAGLLRADSANIWLDGEALHLLPPQARGIGVVFQDALLFPHMSVAANLRYGQRRARPGRIGFDDTVELLGIGGLLDRRPASLSGGERQRVGIGRALLSQPRLLLMDEPLSALDQPRRAEILPYLARLRTALRIPIVYASHAMDEILALADTLVLLDKGRVAAFGPLATLAAQVDLPLALRADAAGVLHGTVQSHDAERRLTAIAAGSQTFMIPLLDAPAGAAVRLLIPAREVILARDAPGLISVNNVFEATVRSMAEDVPSHAALVAIDGGAGPLLARITMDAARRLDLRPGERVRALVKSMSVDVLTD